MSHQHYETVYTQLIFYCQMYNIGTKEKIQRKNLVKGDTKFSNIEKGIINDEEEDDNTGTGRNDEIKKGTRSGKHKKREVFVKGSAAAS